MPVVKRFAFAVLLVFLVFGMASTGVFNSLERLLADARFELTNRPASGQVVFADIDSASLATIGVWPWPREIYAKLLLKLLDEGASEVAFDIDFSSPSNTTSDAAFANALDRAGGYAFLAVFEQLDGSTGEQYLTLPMLPFAKRATPVSVNVTAGDDGLVDGFPADTRGLPSLPVALSRNAAGGNVLIDFGIDLRTVDRVSVRDLLYGDVDPRRLANKQVIVGASALELRDIFSVPRYGMLPGPLVQIAGLETLKAGRALVSPGYWPGLLAALAIAAILAALGPRVRVGSAVAVAVGAIILGLAASLLVQSQYGVTLQVAGFVITMPVLLGLHIASGLTIELRRRRQAEAQLLYLARHDMVTGLPTRRGLVELFNTESNHTILLVALTRLDLVRGTLGRSIADAALRQAVERIDALSSGRLAVVDRDELALLLPADTTQSALDALAREIRRVLRPVFTVDDHTVHVDAVLAATGPAPNLAPEQQLQRAELALQAALQRPASGVTVFVPAMEAVVARRRRIDAALRQAIEERGLSVFFQPQIRTTGTEMVGVEALVRWSSPELGDISPAEFIPIAEETGLIVPLGRLVLTEACRAAASWHWSGKVAVNISASQFKLSDLVETVSDALLETGFEPSRLELEITESVLVDGSERVLDTIARLKSLGIGIAIDDFGTGYSSLSYLARLDFDKLKIDQSFTRRLGAGSPETAIVQTVVELAQRLGKTTVAEGVETEEQRALLAQMGCDVCQGWLTGKPAPADQIAARIHAARAA